MAVKREDPDGMKQVPIIKLENQDPSREENPFYADQVIDIRKRSCMPQGNN